MKYDAPLDGNNAVFLNKVPLIAVPIVVQVFLIGTIRMIVAVNLYRGKNNDSKGMLPISFRCNDVQRIPVFFGTITICRRVLQASVRLIGDAIRNGGKNVRGVSFIGFFKESSTRHPYRDLFFGRFARNVTLFFHRLLKIIRGFVLGIH